MSARGGSSGRTSIHPTSLSVWPKNNYSVRRKKNILCHPTAAVICPLHPSLGSLQVSFCPVASGELLPSRPSMTLQPNMGRLLILLTLGVSLPSKIPTRPALWPISFSAYILLFSLYLGGHQIPTYSLLIYMYIILRPVSSNPNVQLPIWYQSEFKTMPPQQASVPSQNLPPPYPYPITTCQLSLPGLLLPSWFRPPAFLSWIMTKATLPLTPVGKCRGNPQATTWEGVRMKGITAEIRW